MKIYLFLFRTSEGYMFAAEKGILAETKLQVAIDKLPDYDNYHQKGLTWSASATMYWMRFRPCIVAVEGDFNIREWCETKTITIHDVCGSQMGVVIKSDKHEEVEAAIVYEPKLIKDDL